MAKATPYTTELISKALEAEGILTPEVLAYALATIEHETGGTMEPVREGFSDAVGRSEAIKRGYGGGADYYGRGYIQLTHDYNYAEIGERIGMGDELLKNPDLALQPETSAKILAAFFKDRGVAQKVMAGDLVGARRPINPDDKGPSIANRAKVYLNEFGGKVPSYSTPSIQPSVNAGVSSWLKNAFRGFPVPVAGAASPSLTQNYIQPKTSNSYIVKKGDTLWGIAQKMLGSGTKWQQLQGYAGDPRKLPVGTKITAPMAVKPALSTTTPLQKVIAKTTATPVKNPYTFGTSPTNWANNVLKTASKTPAITQAYTPNILGNNSVYKVPTIPGIINLGSYIR